MKNTGIELIAQERKKQIEKNGYDANHDLQHSGFYDYLTSDPSQHSPLLKAAYSFLNILGEKDVNESLRDGDEFDAPNPDVPEFIIPELWPFEDEQWPQHQKTIIERLTIAGALIAAEIDRINLFTPQS